MSKALPLRKEANLVNTVRVEGYLKGKEFTESTDTNGRQYLRGTLVVNTGEFDTDVDFFFYKLRRDGKANKLYESAQKLRDYVSITDLLESGKVVSEEQAKELCDIVSIQGSINPNEYINDEDELISRPQINGTFFHRQNRSRVKVENFGVSFDVEIFFDSIKPEFKDNIETGRAIIEAVVPTYIETGALGAMTFYVADKVELPNGEIVKPAEYILDNYDSKASGRVNGKFVVTETATEAATTAGFGTASSVSSSNFKYEWIITGGEERQYPVGGLRDFNEEAIQEGLARRLAKAQEYKARRASQAPSTQPAGFGRTPTQNVSQRTAAAIVDQFSSDDF